MRTIIPPHIVEMYGSARRFKEAKRADIRVAEAAISDLRKGCAYLPSGSGPLDTIEGILGAIANECSIKEWGR